MPTRQAEIIAALRCVVAEEYDDYAGEHQAPTNNGTDAPLYDVTLNEIYPDDIYSGDAARLYSSGQSYDGAAISIIQSAHNRPKTQIKVYRSIPDDLKEVKDKLKKLNSIMSYYYKFKFFKPGEKLINELEEKYRENFEHDKMTYDEFQEAVIKDIDDQRDALAAKIKAVGRGKINKGDWVGITKQYAVDHGKDHLKGKFKVVTKTVPAKHLWADGNSIQEWGYDPS